MSATDAVVRAIRGRTDERGFARTTVADLMADTGLSSATIRRVLDQLTESGLLQKRAKRGVSGGLLLRLVNSSSKCSSKCSQSAQNERFRDAFTRGAGPFGALAPPLRLVIPTNGSSVLPAVNDERARKWRMAITTSIRKGLRHSPECFKRGRATAGCPYCDSVQELLDR